MQNPFSEEQVRQLNEIGKLPPTEQQAKLQAMFSTFNEEQIKFLQNQQKAVQEQGGQCPFCMIVEGKIPSQKIYEDDQVIAVLDINPATRGHTLVMPKKHYALTAQMPDGELAHLFMVVNNLAKHLFETMKAEGTNIFLANGAAAGQRAPHVFVHVIPRYNGDGVNFEWEGKKAEDEELAKIREQILKEGFEIKEEVEEEPEEIIEHEFEMSERIP
ncbi:HIT family protein [Patescibacteria group bacterium]|nr:HIT family protein [Patescibacteria group bacterium]